MSRHRYTIVILALAAVLNGGTLLPRGAAVAQDKVPFSDEAVEAAIEKAKAHLWSLYRDAAGADPWPETRTHRDSAGKEVPYVNYGGQSALIMYALLAGGDKPTDARMKRAIEWLAKIDSHGTYTLGMRMQVWTFLPRELHRPLLAKDADRLMKSMGRPENPTAARNWSHVYGGYTYGANDKPTTTADGSNTHIGILGVWAAEQMNMEIPKGYWQIVYEHYVRSQSTDGTWRYGVGPGPPAAGGNYGQYPPGGMTAAGLANLTVAWENVHAGDFAACGKNPDLPQITKAAQWLGDNLGRHYNGYLYYLYALERCSLATGLKYLGGKDWYKESATRLLNTQRPDGSWARGGFGDSNDTVATAFGLIFLVRGRNPVMINRLQYPGEWNNRPAALSALTRWVGRTFESEINWQIVDLSTAVSEWHDAPILLISGAKAPTFTDEQITKLRRFVQQGGLIFTVAECRGQGMAFDLAWRGKPGLAGIYEKLFPEYELRALPPDSPIFKGHFTTRRRIPMWGVSNGVRLLAVHTNDDVTLPWQTNAHATLTDYFEMAVNLSMLVNDKALGRPRGTSPWPEELKAQPAATVPVARVKYNGNWDPEPLAWERLDLLMQKHWKTKVTATAVPADKLNANATPVAAMTGTNELKLTDEEKKGIKAYVEAGGTLLVDAAGGSEAFAKSAAAVIEEIFGADSLKRLATASGVYQLADMAINSVAYRRAAREALGGAKHPMLQAVMVGDRPGVIFSAQDITSGLVGYPSLTIIGYEPGSVAKPGSAVELVRNIVLLAAGQKK